MHSPKILFIDQQPRYRVSEDTSLIDVLDYYRDKLGKDRTRQMKFSIKQIPAHSDL